LASCGVGPRRFGNPRRALRAKRLDETTPCVLARRQRGRPERAAGVLLGRSQLWFVAVDVDRIRVDTDAQIEATRLGEDSSFQSHR